MNYQDSSSDDVPYLPPEQFQHYEQHQQQSEKDGTYSNLASGDEKRKGRSHFTQDELHELDGQDERHVNPAGSVHVIHDVPPQSMYPPGYYGENVSELEIPVYSKVSWGRKAIGILLITIPAVLLSVAAHFIDWPMSEFQLFSASFFIFQGVLWPSFGILLIDQFCTSKSAPPPTTTTTTSKVTTSPQTQVTNTSSKKWIVVLGIFIHGVLSATAMIFQLLSIQRLNISVSLALSFGFDVIIILIRYISERKRCSYELLFLTVLSYSGFAVVGIPAFISHDTSVRKDYAIGVAASVGVMLFSIPSSFFLGYLRRQSVSDSTIGTSFAFCGCLLSILTKEIMGSSISDLSLDGKSIGWIAGLISVVFLGTIFLFLESRLSGLIWERDEDKPREYSSISRTRLAIFIISCVWEFARQGFRKTSPDPYEILGGFLVVLGCLLASGYEAWSRSHSFEDGNGASSSSHTFCAFIPWLFSRKSKTTGN